MSYDNGNDDGRYGASYYGSSGKFEVGRSYDSTGSTGDNAGIVEVGTGDAGDGDAGRPKVLLMGMRRSGKSSIQKVVFHKMSPNETLFLESTNKIIKEPVSNSSFVQFSIWDFPGQIDFLEEEYDLESIFSGTGAIIFVIDAQDDYMEAVSKLVSTVSKAHSINPEIHCEVFIHKVDSLSDETRMETQRDIHSRALDELSSENPAVQLTFYLTSIYDHSIFEAFSKVVQKLIPQLPTLENMLNMFVQHSSAEKAFLFDVVSKIYIATDSSPVDMQSYELCCDMIDLVIDVSCIYGLKEEMDSASFDNKSASVVRLNNNTVLYLREVDKVLALVCILREENYARPPDTIYPNPEETESGPSNASVVDFNFSVLRQGIKEVFEVRDKFRRLYNELEEASR